MKKLMVSIIEFIKNPYNGMFALFKRLIEQLMSLFGMKVKPFYDKSDFAWLQVLEDNYEIIKSELLNVYQGDFIKPTQEINKNVATYTTDDKWKIFTLWVYGNKIEKNCNLCPETNLILSQIPNFFTVFFSILEPGKEIKKHRGVYRGNTLAHLGLVVPKPITSCTFHVGNETKNWEEGKAFAFEDSFNHFVTNTASSYRAVLIVEFRRQVPKILRPFDNFIQNKIKNSSITRNILKGLGN
jgi:aspartyl/asparaginyl beta-hydroxylase (cupin superfamily)